MVLKRKEDYEEASDDNAWRLLAEVSLSKERFQEVKAYIFEAVGVYEEVEDESTLKETEEEVDAGNEGPFSPILHGNEECYVLQ